MTQARLTAGLRRHWRLAVGCTPRAARGAWCVVR